MNEKTMELLAGWRGDVHIGSTQNEAAELMAYRETGLTPEEIKKGQQAINPMPFGEFVEIMWAKRAGRAIILPCKVGDTVWIVSGEKVYECMLRDAVSYQAVNFNLEIIRTVNGRVNGIQTVFLTREEAEASLNGLSHENS